MGTKQKKNWGRYHNPERIYQEICARYSKDRLDRTSGICMLTGELMEHLDSMSLKEQLKITVYLNCFIESIINDLQLSGDDADKARILIGHYCFTGVDNALWDIRRGDEVE